MRRQRAPRRRGRQQLIAIAVSIGALSGTGGVALAGSGGGIDIPAPPEVSDVFCVEACADIRAAAAGSRVELTGRGLGSVDRVSFTATEGGRIKVPVRVSEARRVAAIVPDGAATGKPRALDPYGQSDGAPRELRIVDASRIPESGDFKLARAAATPHRVFYDARSRPKVTYSFEGGAATDVRIDVIKRGTGEVAASFRQGDREPFAQHVARWDGRLDSGRVAPQGDYRFRVGPVSGGAETTSESRFSLYGNKFPVRGRHGYGDGFGAGRNHQGQDVFAKCGTRLVAARGGRVKYRETHEAAGNYLVIDARRTNKDYFYAHLRRRSPLGPGDRVRTGQTIGEVGDTGNAQGCHLHFELWRGAWQEGGSALKSVTRSLRAWDSWS